MTPGRTGCSVPVIHRCTVAIAAEPSLLVGASVESAHLHLHSPWPDEKPPVWRARSLEWSWNLRRPGVSCRSLPLSCLAVPRGAAVLWLSHSGRSSGAHTPVNSGTVGVLGPSSPHLARGFGAVMNDSFLAFAFPFTGWYQAELPSPFLVFARSWRLMGRPACLRARLPVALV